MHFLDDETGAACVLLGSRINLDLQVREQERNCEFKGEKWTANVMTLHLIAVHHRALCCVLQV